MWYQNSSNLFALTLSMLGKNSADNILKYVFFLLLFYPEIDFDIFMENFVEFSFSAV